MSKGDNMAKRNMTDKERRTWGNKWEKTRKRIMIDAKKRGINLSKIMIVPRGE